MFFHFPLHRVVFVCIFWVAFHYRLEVLGFERNWDMIYREKAPKAMDRTCSIDIGLIG